MPCQCPTPGTYAAPAPPPVGRFPDASVFGPPPGGWPGTSDPAGQFTVPLGEASPENLAAAMGQADTDSSAAAWTRQAEYSQGQRAAVEPPSRTG